MDTGQLFLVLLFVLTVASLVTLKLCASRLDHRTAPVFISVWILAGLAAVFPVFGHLLGESLPVISAKPWLLGVLFLKGAGLYLLLVASQDLMKISLSSRHYVTPLSLGLVAICNSFLGEDLSPVQWFSALGLCALAIAFLVQGHAADLDRRGRLIYAKLVALTVVLAGLDQLGISELNWYTVLLFSNLAQLGIGLAVGLKHRHLLRQSLLHPAALLAGTIYAATELVKFYQQVTINPVTAVLVTQAMTKPVILLLSAIVWKERTIEEQFIWGALAFAVVLPMFIAA